MPRLDLFPVLMVIITLVGIPLALSLLGRARLRMGAVCNLKHWEPEDAVSKEFRIHVQNQRGDGVRQDVQVELILTRGEWVSSHRTAEPTIEVLHGPMDTEPQLAIRSATSAHFIARGGMRPRTTWTIACRATPEAVLRAKVWVGKTQPFLVPPTSIVIERPLHIYDKGYGGSSFPAAFLVLLAASVGSWMLWGKLHELGQTFADVSPVLMASLTGGLSLAYGYVAGRFMQWQGPQLVQGFMGAPGDPMRKRSVKTAEWPSDSSFE